MAKTILSKEFAKAGAVVLAVFIAGAGSGYFAGRWHATSMMLKRQEAFIARSARRPWRFARRSRRGARFMHRLERDLALRPNQRDRVQQLLDRHYRRLTQMRREMMPKIKDIFADARKEIRAFLDENQKASFDRMVKRFERRRRRWRRKFMHGRPPMMRGGTPQGTREVNKPGR